MVVYPHYEDVRAWPWPNFRPAEFASQDGGAIMIVPAFMARLQRLRDDYARPMVISSGYRTPQHNARVSTTGSAGPHTTGRACDVRVHGRDALDLVGLALRHGFTGIGIAQKGPHGSRFIHLDDLAAGPGCPRPWIWSYP